jgi:hypothetical protein
VIADIGIPVGRPQTLVIDLSGRFLSASREVRIVTNMRIYWDQILVSRSSEGAKAQMMRLDPMIADLRWRGYSAQVTPDGREPFGYDYHQVSHVAPWKIVPGRYTREGDVKELLMRTDDVFVISRPGDEIALSFDATGLPPLARGWNRTFLFYVDGFSKEMDINSATPDSLGPLPFHAMERYPYSAPERFPMTAAHDGAIQHTGRSLHASSSRSGTGRQSFFNRNHEQVDRYGSHQILSRSLSDRYGESDRAPGHARKH